MKLAPDCGSMPSSSVSKPCLIPQTRVNFKPWTTPWYRCWPWDSFLWVCKLRCLKGFKDTYQYVISVFHGILAIYSISRIFFPWCQFDVESKQRRSHLVHRRAFRFKVLLENFLPQTVGEMYAGSWRSLISPRERCDSWHIDWWTVVDFHHRRSQRIGCHLLLNGPYPFSSSLRHSYNIAFEESLRIGGRHRCTLGEPMRLFSHHNIRLCAP